MLITSLLAVKALATMNVTAENGKEASKEIGGHPESSWE